MGKGSLKRLLTSWVTVFRQSSVKDNYGGVTASWDKHEWLLKCRIYGARGGYSIQMEGKQYNISHKMICDADDDLIAGDKIRESKTKNMYFVVQVYETREMKTVHHKEVFLTEISE
ncbi:hypothetical protein ACFL2J_05580 [Candidatus Omnitrophota bacterium]